MNRLALAVEDRRRANKEIFELHSGSHDFASGFFPAHILREAFEEYSRTPGYKPDPRGEASARQAIADLYERDCGLSISPDRIMLTSGSSESYAWIFRILCQSTSESILTGLPSYPLFAHIADYARVQLQEFDLDFGQISSESLASCNTGAGPRAMLLVSPHNPLGTILNRESMRVAEAFAREKSAALIFDEVFSHFVWDKTFAGPNFPRPGSDALSFTLNGASKLLCLPGLKLSWILVQGPDADALGAMDSLEMISDTFLPVNAFAQRALPALLNARSDFHPTYLAELSASLALTEEILAGIPGFRWIRPQGGFTIVVEMDERYGDEEDFVLGLLEETGVHLYPGYFFDMDSDASRIILSFQHPRSVLREGLGRLKDFAARAAKSSG